MMNSTSAVHRSAARTGPPSTWSMLVSQSRYQIMTYTRSPVAMFFTLGLPIVMLVLFGSIFSGQTVPGPNGEWPVSQFYTGGLAAFTAVSATYTSTVNMIPVRRDEGVLKRWHSTPLPTWILFAGWVVSASIIAILGVIIQLAIGIVFYDLYIELDKVPALVVTVILGIGTFSALGVAIAGLVPNGESAPAVANATILPLAFVSDIFIPIDNAPDWLTTIGNIFPLKPFANAFHDALNPTVVGPAFEWGKWAALLAWGVFGFVLARMTFRWYPARSSGRKRRGRQANA